MLDKNALKKAFPVILLTIVVAISVSLLSFADKLTRPQIEAQQQKKIQTLLTGMFPEMSRYDLDNDIYIIYSDEAKIGYAFIAVGKGYGGDIDILVGLENKTTIKGISIVSHTETPGLGSRITESSFTDQFAGLNIDSVALKKAGGEVDAITGSTISSTAVINAVRETAMEKVKLIEDDE